MLAGVDDHDPPAEETKKQSGRNQSASAEPPHDLKDDPEEYALPSPTPVKK
jgi:hypothetical protein